MKITRRQLRQIIKEELHRVILSEGTAETKAVKVIMQTPNLTPGWTSPRWDISEGTVGGATKDTGSFQDTLIVTMMQGGGAYLSSHQTIYVLEIRSDGTDVTFNVKFAGVDEDRRVTSALETAIDEILTAWPDDKAALKATKPGVDYRIPSIPDGLVLKN